MIKNITDFLKNSCGAVAPLAAVAMPLLLGITALGVDVSTYVKSNRDMQAAVDAAAIAAGWEMAYGGSENEATAAALKEAMHNGYQNLVENDLALSFETNAEGQQQVTVQLTSAAEKYFANTFYDGDLFNVTVAATAAVINPGDYCMLSLGSNGLTLNISGGVTIDSAGCGIAANSNGDPAIKVNGSSSDIEIGDVYVVGTVENGDQLINEEGTNNVMTGMPPVADPYADLEIPPYDECTKNEQNAGPIVATSMDDLPAPDADGVTVICGGLEVGNGNTLDLDPGVYIVDGGDVNIKSGGTLLGEGVSIILTNSGADEVPSYGSFGDLQFSGNVDISAPLPGDLDAGWSDFEGVALYQDRNAPSQVQCNDLKGSNSSAIVVDGTMYFPSRCLDIGGNASPSSEDTCSRVIALEIKIHGNPNIANNCEGKGVDDINAGEYAITLVL